MFKCYSSQVNNSDDMFKVDEGYTYSGLEKATVSYNKLKSMQNQIASSDFHAGFISDSDLDTMGAKLSEWLSSISE